MSDDEEIPAATALAIEIHHGFARKMAPGGAIDRILNGGEPIQKRPPKSDEEIALCKRQIETQLQEYEAAIGSALTWQREWKLRQTNRGFRCVERSISKENR